MRYQEYWRFVLDAVDATLDSMRAQHYRFSKGEFANAMAQRDIAFKNLIEAQIREFDYAS